MMKQELYLIGQIKIFKDDLYVIIWIFLLYLHAGYLISAENSL
jgi:hypothetical protein